METYGNSGHVELFEDGGELNFEEGCTIKQQSQYQLTAESNEIMFINYFTLLLRYTSNIGCVNLFTL
jgi:hypothetical protein